MNGPQHFAEAEALLDDVQQFNRDDPYRAQIVGEAQVHAILALAAAQAQATESSVFTARPEWFPVVGTRCAETGCERLVYSERFCGQHQPF